MRGRLGSVVGRVGLPSDNSATGLWRLSEVYAVRRGIIGSGWPRSSVNLSWQTSLDADATKGSASLTVNVAPAVGFSSIPFSYLWERSVDGGANWLEVSGSQGSGQTSQNVALSLTGQGPANIGDKYRLVVQPGLRRAVSQEATVRIEQSFSEIVYSQPTSTLVASGSGVWLYSNVLLSGNTFYLYYNPSYQWQRSMDSGQTWEDVGEVQESSASYYFVAQPSDNGSQYRAKITLGSAYESFSPVATITVS